MNGPGPRIHVHHGPHHASHRGRRAIPRGAGDVPSRVGLDHTDDVRWSTAPVARAAPRHAGTPFLIQTHHRFSDGVRPLGACQHRVPARDIGRVEVSDAPYVFSPPRLEVVAVQARPNRVPAHLRHQRVFEHLFGDEPDRPARGAQRRIGAHHHAHGRHPAVPQHVQHPHVRRHQSKRQGRSWHPPVYDVRHC